MSKKNVIGTHKLLDENNLKKHIYIQEIDLFASLLSKVETEQIYSNKRVDEDKKESLEGIGNG